jgi:hypothetical protein
VLETIGLRLGDILMTLCSSTKELLSEDIFRVLLESRDTIEIYPVLSLLFSVIF